MLKPIWQKNLQVLGIGGTPLLRLNTETSVTLEGLTVG